LLPTGELENIRRLLNLKQNGGTGMRATYSKLQKIFSFSAILFFMSANISWAANDNLAWMSLLLSNSVGTVTSAGQVWMDRNLGASSVATSSTDSQAYGDSYQWGRGTDGHEKRTSATTSSNSTSDNPGHGQFITETADWRTPQNHSLWQGESGINNPCPSGFRLPTETELNTERTSWSSNNAAGAFASPTKLVVAGYRDVFNGTVSDAGSGGYYWSSTVNGTYSRTLYFGSGGAYMDSGDRAFGVSVRCLKD
jgi:uncharacterized protein (TIGR02145 family)